MSIISTASDEVTMKSQLASEAFEAVLRGGLSIVPTKVGYILAGFSGRSLEKKFDLKLRPLKKPAVVLTRFKDLDVLARIPKSHRNFLAAIEKTGVLCGFIFSRKEEVFSVADEKARELSCLPDGTSCFVINHGAYTEYLADRADQAGIFILASSANQSGTGNRGRFQNIGERILSGVDYAIEHDEYVVQRYQPDSGEQGVMINLLHEKPILIRKGLNEKEIMEVLTAVYGPQGQGWIYDHGAYA